MVKDTDPGHPVESWSPPSVHPLETIANMPLGWLVTCTSNRGPWLRFQIDGWFHYLPAPAVCGLCMFTLCLYGPPPLPLSPPNTSCSGGYERAGFKLPLLCVVVLLLMVCVFCPVYAGILSWPHWYATECRQWINGLTEAVATLIYPASVLQWWDVKAYCQVILILCLSAPFDISQ